MLKKIRQNRCSFPPLEILTIALTVNGTKVIKLLRKPNPILTFSPVL